MSTKVVTGLVRLSYANIFEPASVQEGDEKKYSTSILIPKDDKKTLAKIEAAIKAAKEQGKDSKWGGKIPGKMHIPLRDGDEERPDDPAYENMFFLNASSKRKPGVVDRNVQPILDPEEVYSGCWARVDINFFPFKASGNSGVAVGLNNIQKVKDGEPLGGTVSSAEDVFDAYEDEGMFD